MRGGFLGCFEGSGNGLVGAVVVVRGGFNGRGGGLWVLWWSGFEWQRR